MKSKLPLWILSGSLALFSSCSKNSSEDTTPAQTYLDVVVLDGNSYSAQNTQLSGVSGAKVTLYATRQDVANNNPAYTSYTYNTGEVIMPVAYQSTCYMVVTKGSQRNIYNNLLVAGIFQSTTEIQQSPGQTPAGTVGSVKYKDINGDGKIDQNDDTNAAAVQVAQNTNNPVTSVIYYK